MDGAVGSPHQSGPGSPVFIGRRVEVASIEQFLRSVRNGHVAMAVVEAEAGAGKTSLLRHIATEVAGPAGFTIFSADGDPNDSRALRCITESLGCRPTSADPTRARVADLLRSSTTTGGVTSAVQELVLEIIERASIEAPTVLLIDDLQWVDAASLSLVGSLLRRMRGTPFGVLAATRPSNQVRAALAPFGVHHVTLGRLDDDEFAELTWLHSGSMPTAELLVSLEPVRSNLFMLSMLARANTDDRERRPAETFRMLTAGLEPELRALLELAAVGGREVDVDALALASGRPLADIVRLTRDGVRRGWLTSDGETVVFRHDLLVEAVVSTLPIDERDCLHLALGRSLARLGHQPGRAAFHLDAAGYLLGPLDGALIRPLLDVLPWDDPAVFALAERAHGLDPADVDALVALMHCLAVRHRHREVTDAARQWLDLGVGGPEATGRVRLLAATSMVTVLGSEAVIDHLESLLDEGTLTPSQRADALNTITRFHWHQRDSALVLASATRALDASRAAASVSGEVQALCSRSEAQAIVGEVESALADARAAGALVTAASLTTAMPALALGTAMSSAGQMREALPMLTQALRAAERAGDPQAMVLAQVTMQATRYHTGEWDAFVADADAMAEVGRDSMVRAGIVLPLGFAAAVAVRRGRFAEVPTIAARLRAEYTLGDSHPGALIGVGLLEIAELEAVGRLSDACRHAAVMAEFLAVAGTSAQSLVVIDAARLAWQVGERDVLALALDMTSHAAALSRTPTRQFLYEFIAAIAADDAERIVAAARNVAGTQRAWDGAISLHIAGIEGRRASLDASGDLLTAAAARYEALGCLRHMQIARDGLGFDALYGHATAPATTDPVALSGAEVKVLRLVVDGLPNGDIADALFVSKRTVESHLGSLYRKTGVTTRVALARVGVAAFGATANPTM